MIKFHRMSRLRNRPLKSLLRLLRSHLYWHIYTIYLKKNHYSRITRFFIFTIKSLKTKNVDIEDSISEIQFVSITSTGFPFAIVYDGVYSGKYRYY